MAEDLAQLDAVAPGDATPFAFALCDVDRFKDYNDRLGHLAGDEALRAVAGAIRAELRAGDGAYRYGGEEILVVLRGLDGGAAHAAAERLRHAVRARSIPHPDGIGGVITVPIGVATGRADVAAVLAQADAALYAAKEAGRDRVVAATPDLGAEAARPAGRAFRSRRSGICAAWSR
jgi:diguanylate cyclase (GGDEF)-like protein